MEMLAALCVNLHAQRLSHGCGDGKSQGFVHHMDTRTAWRAGQPHRTYPSEVGRGQEQN